MPSAIPPSIASYIQASLDAQSQTLITSVLSTPSTWLALRVVYAAIHGVEDVSRGHSLALGSSHHAVESRPVIFVSLLRPLSLWTEMGRKMGLDVQSLLKNRRIIYIDGLSFPSGHSSPADPLLLPTMKLKSLDLSAVRDAVNTALKSMASSTATATATSSQSPSILTASSSARPTPRMPMPPASRPPAAASPSTHVPSTKPVIVLDGIDFVLASEPACSTLALDSFLSSLRAQCHALVVTGNADAPLLQTAGSEISTGTPLERSHAHFLTSMAHRCQWVWQLRGLDTGSAKDVTGVLRMSRGGDVGVEEDEVSHERLPDAEWLYQVKGDSSVRVWSRGE
ncbi:hypothetical protein LTR99_007949 [Exophiala xenobiotica]|uniref:Elongator complex protein 6 n=1 Tax=Vermiconidia calcicola TaxID=1690605 RepID=A0AAV9Q3F2_9PEZI|nr:hypothetical protein H2202_005786 [Exophiala xenobiotica]KAK5535081.1 hypothetical protein LTR25_006089 [Vermiconidia calcicola]KAK5209291.1 hypothetical protein LTR41_004827 [Exophiala xenobiotica]KAK5298260.1 hypothetical protein LTR99_007949 [Exophiala xenobiotica]KAK5323400.1 hypothetical protein LTR93_005453 [Exophiala xenobiotica]